MFPFPNAPKMYISNSDSIEEQKDQDKFVDYKKTIPNKAPFPGTKPF